MDMQSICLLNDSFPPLIDGVANAVTNYAKILQKNNMEPVVITPDHPEANDSVYPYPVLRYPSIDLRERTGYFAGVPFSPELVREVSGRNVSLLHSHCPVVSTMLARELRQILDVPIVLTYHTKFDIDIANIMKSRTLQEASKRALLENINACDEVWAVSKGAADNLHSLGYEGECVIMHNGVDLPLGRVSDSAIQEAAGQYDLPDDLPVFLFVGRIMWYKGLSIILDALAKLKETGQDFRMVLIGTGSDLSEVQTYAEACGIAGKCLFTGAIHNRETLRAWYCRSSLFLFPSTFDTNGLVVREAAACSLASVLIADSCAAEGITDGRNGFLIEENADSMFACLRTLCANRDKMIQVGQAAARELYVSWETAVETALERYQYVIERYQSGYYPPHRKAMEGFFRANGELMEGLAHIQMLRKNIHEQIKDHIAEQREHFKDMME